MLCGFASSFPLYPLFLLLASPVLCLKLPTGSLCHPEGMLSCSALLGSCCCSSYLMRRVMGLVTGSGEVHTFQCAVSSPGCLNTKLSSTIMSQCDVCTFLQVFCYFLILWFNGAYLFCMSLLC